MGFLVWFRYVVLRTFSVRKNRTISVYKTECLFARSKRILFIFTFSVLRKSYVFRTANLYVFRTKKVVRFPYTFFRTFSVLCFPELVAIWRACGQFSDGVGG